MEKLLIVDDQEAIRTQLKWGFTKDYSVTLAGSAEDAMAAFSKYHPRVVTLDLGLPPQEDGAEEGLRCLGEMLRIQPKAKIIVVTGNTDRENALRAIQSGAYDFYHKPIELAELKVIVSRAFHLARLEDEISGLQRKLAKTEELGMIGQCPEMQHVFSLVRKVAASEVSVLVQGESGTGKELVARALHAMSMRKDGPFIAINCGAIPDNLLESELFGHEKGAFTGAVGTVHGKFEYAEGGTLFLDEIGELPAPLQVKLLRFLQEKTIQRVGGRHDIAVNTRIVAATNSNIEQAILDGKFRDDLYYRIGVIALKLPPLRNRGDDIQLLANVFLKRFADAYGKKIRGFSPAAADMLRHYAWPGNVRELENRLQRAVILSEQNTVELADLTIGGTPIVTTHKSIREGLSLREARDQVERDMIRWAVEKGRGNMAKAADMLSVSRPTLYDLMKKHNLSAE
ncbi:MAG TPA: PEP-CTERM-box response regulator transcription factor [Dissulfurispiraceae bacterium]|nr:PEP-CTERM-box response regulator transcription factor [Dissulfurispiraceae bacterium]